MSAAETYAWHDSEMKEINSLLCKYMRVTLRGRAKTVEDGRVRQWSNQRLHEHWRIPAVFGGSGSEENWMAEGDAAG